MVDPGAIVSTCLPDLRNVVEGQFQGVHFPQSMAVAGEQVGHECQDDRVRLLVYFKPGIFCQNNSLPLGKGIYQAF